MASADLPPALRKRIYARSGGRCELYVEFERLRGRCSRRGAEIHHMLTKARGGRVLDSVGETIHLIHLCQPHHRAADGGRAYEAGLLIDGYVQLDKVTGRPRYYGTDPDLRRLYPIGRSHPDAARGDEPTAGDSAA